MIPERTDKDKSCGPAVLCSCTVFSWCKGQRFFADGGNASQLGTKSKSTQINHSLGHRLKAHQHCPERFASPATARNSVNPSRVTLTETKHGIKKHCRPPRWRRVWSFNCETARIQDRLGKVAGAMRDNDVAIGFLQRHCMDLEAPFRFENCWVQPQPRQLGKHYGVAILSTCADSDMRTWRRHTSGSPGHHWE